MAYFDLARTFARSRLRETYQAPDRRRQRYAALTPSGPQVDNSVLVGFLKHRSRTPYVAPPPFAYQTVSKRRRVPGSGLTEYSFVPVERWTRRRRCVLPPFPTTPTVRTRRSIPASGQVELPTFPRRRVSRPVPPYPAFDGRARRSFVIGSTFSPQRVHRPDHQCHDVNPDMLRVHSTRRFVPPSGLTAAARVPSRRIARAVQAPPFAGRSVRRLTRPVTRTPERLYRVARGEAPVPRMGKSVRRPVPFQGRTANPIIPAREVSRQPFSPPPFDGRSIKRPVPQPTYIAVVPERHGVSNKQPPPKTLSGACKRRPVPNQGLVANPVIPAREVEAGWAGQPIPRRGRTYRRLVPNQGQVSSPVNTGKRTVSPARTPNPAATVQRWQNGRRQGQRVTVAGPASVTGPLWTAIGDIWTPGATVGQIRSQ